MGGKGPQHKDPVSSNCPRGMLCREAGKDLGQQGIPKSTPVRMGAEASGYNLACAAWCVTGTAPAAFLQMQQETGTKTSISLFQWQETTTSKQSKLKSDGNAGSCQALGLLEPAPAQSYKNTVLQQHLGNTDPGIAQNPCLLQAG